MPPKDTCLSVLQEAALALLANGYSSYQTAVLLGLQHAFIEEWINYNSIFKTELEKRREKTMPPEPSSHINTVPDPLRQSSTQVKQVTEPESSQGKGQFPVETISAFYNLIDSKSQEHEKMIQQLCRSNSTELKVSLYMRYVLEERENIKFLHEVMDKMLKQR